MRFQQYGVTFVAVVVLALASACSGDDDGPKTQVDHGTPLGEGIVKEVTGSVQPLENVAEGQGELLLDIFHGDRAVNKKVKVRLASDDARDADVAMGEGNHGFALPAGLYFAYITYKEADELDAMEGTVAALKVNPGHQTKYNVVLEAPIGLLQLRFTRSDGPARPPVKIDEEVELNVYPSGGDRSSPVWTGKGGEWIALTTGSYDVKASYDDGSGMPTVEWYEGLELAGGLARTKREVHLDLDATGVRVNAFNFSSDINDSTQVYFFFPGANVEVARARTSGPAGESIAVEPGTYDLYVVYTPSTDNPDLLGKTLIKDFVVPERGGVRHNVDLVLETAKIGLKVLDGEEDVGERVELHVKRAGADSVAGSSVLEATGVSTHIVGAGTYDLYLIYEPAEGDRRVEAFRGVELSNGSVWEQSFQATDATWAPTDTVRPAAPLRAITWEPPKGDDDDSGADDDDSAPAPAGDDRPEGEGEPK